MVECLPLVEVPLSSGIFSVARLGLFFFASFVAFFFPSLVQLWVSYFVVEVAMIVVAWERMSSAPVISSPCFVGMFLWLFTFLT